MVKGRGPLENTTMKSLGKQTIAEQLNSARLAIEVSQGAPEILAAVLKRGYTPADFTAAHLLYSEAMSAVLAADAAGKDAQRATESFELARSPVEERYAEFARVGRSAFKRDRVTLDVLGLVGARPRAIDQFMLATAKLFNTSKWTPAITTKLRKRGISDSWLSEARGALEEMKLARNQQKSLGGKAQKSTVAQTKALKPMVDWCQEYIEVARVVFKDSPQTLEELGIVVPNGRTRAQVLGVRKAAATRKRNAELKKAA